MKRQRLQSISNPIRLRRIIPDLKAIKVGCSFLRSTQRQQRQTPTTTKPLCLKCSKAVRRTSISNIVPLPSHPNSLSWKVKLSTACFQTCCKTSYRLGNMKCTWISRVLQIFTISPATRFLGKDNFGKPPTPKKKRLHLRSTTVIIAEGQKVVCSMKILVMKFPKLPLRPCSSSQNQ